MGWTKGKLAMVASCTVLASTGLFGVIQAAAGTNHSDGQSSAAGAGKFHRGFAVQRALTLGLLKDAAVYLHVSPQDLHKSLASGKSLNDVAAANNISQADLQAELKTLVHNELQSRVSQGKLTADKEAALEQRIDAYLPQLAAKTHVATGTKPLRGKQFLLGQVAKILNLAPKDLLTKLKSGQSLADIAAAQGSSIQALTTQLQSEVDAKVNAKISDSVQRLAAKSSTPSK